MVTDKYDLTNKILPPTERFDVVVVGAGSAGTAAAMAASQAGKTVLLIDEHPVAGAAMGNDRPLFFGGRTTAATQNSGRMLEQVFASNPALEQAFAAGIDVRLSTAGWGLYRNGPAIRTLPEPMLGLVDAERTTMIGFGQLVLATGALLVLVVSLMQFGLKRVTATRAIVILVSELFFAAASAWWLADEVPGARDFIGGALIIGASLIAASVGRR